MCCSDPRRVVAALLLAIAWPASAEHVFSLGFEADTEESKAVSLLGSIAVADETWVSGSLARSRSPAGLFDIDTWYFDLGVDHHFDPLGIRVAAGYWGESDLLDSVDLRAGLYWKNDRASLSLDYERRAFDLTVRSLLLDRPRRTEFEADGLGLSARAKLSDSVSVYANGMHYDYSRDISLEPNIGVLRFFALSRLSTYNSLIEDRLSGGIEFSFGTRIFDIRASSWETAVFGDRVDSLGVGLLMPVGDASDLELRLATDDSDGAGRATVFSVFFYFYGD